VTEALNVVMPVYNEEAIAGTVVRAWCRMLGELGVDYRFHAYNDGSRDGSLAVLRALARELPRLVVHDKPNTGHGPTILGGYRAHADATWLFQIDSDDEVSPDDFPAMWAARHEYDLLIGRRPDRHGPRSRRLVSAVSRFTVRLCFGTGVSDPNCPFRLMRAEKFRALLERLPPDTFAPNIMVSGFAMRAGLRIRESPVTHRGRRTGEVSIKRLRLLRAACRSFGQTLRFWWGQGKRREDAR